MGPYFPSVDDFAAFIMCAWLVKYMCVLVGYGLFELEFESKVCAHNPHANKVVFMLKGAQHNTPHHTARLLKAIAVVFQHFLFLFFRVLKSFKTISFLQGFV